ncbi:MAG: hypothetical protein ACFB2W_00680 [Leptolyngbyaceae cyanobacterium]
MSLSAWAGFAGLGLRLLLSPKDPQDIPQTLGLINAVAHQRIKKDFADPITRKITEGFSVEGRGWDARLDDVFRPGFHTAWVVFPDGYRVKVGIHPKVDALLDEDSSKVLT